MTARTKYFVIVSLLVLGIGLGTGLVAYYVGFPARAAADRGGPAELEYLPRDASVVAYANVQDVMTSDLRRRLDRAVPQKENGQREFQNETGINIETDIDRVVACLNPDPESNNHPGAGMVLARGRFDEARIESLMRDHGARVENYKGARLILTDKPQAGSSAFALAFIEPGLVGVGSAQLVRAAMDLHAAGDGASGQSVTGNAELMNIVRSMDDGNAWAVGRFDVLSSQAHLPANLAGQLPPITWFSVNTHIDGGIRGSVRAEARDEQGANNLRDVVRGFLALAKMQTGSRPELASVVDSLQLGGTGRTVSLSFDLPLAVFDAMSGAARQRAPQRPPR